MSFVTEFPLAITVLLPQPATASPRSNMCVGDNLVNGLPSLRDRKWMSPGT